jgi:fibronectin type 3 domain-containing protein
LTAAVYIGDIWTADDISLGPPAAPAGLTAPSPTTESPSLSWTAVSNATSYNIYRDGTDIGSSNTNSYTDSSATAGGVYSYSVTAVNTNGESGPSNTINVVVTPTITLTSNGTVNLNAIPTGNGVQTIASDSVSVSTNDGSGYTLQLNETNGSTTLTSGSNTIPATTGTKSSPVAETAESWGYRVDSIGGFGSGPTTSLSNQPIGSLTFAAVPASTSPDTIKTTATTANNDTTNVWYGIAVDTSVPSGTYTNSVTYTAVAN